MKKIFLIIFTFIIAFTSLTSVAQTNNIHLTASPISRAMVKLNFLKQTPAEKRSSAALYELAIDLTRLNEKDHNQFLFSLMKMYENERGSDERDFLIGVITNWEKHGKTKTAEYQPASNWAHAANLTVGLLGALAIRRMVKGRFITPPVHHVETVQAVNPRLRNFLEQKIAKLNLSRLATRANLISNSVSAATFVGILVLMDEQFYDSLTQGLYDIVGPENMEFFKIFYSTKIPPFELWQMMDPMILCENHSRLVEISNDLDNQDKAVLQAYLEEINHQITPNLESIASNSVNKNRLNRLMNDGIKPKTDKQMQYALKDIDTRQNNPIKERGLMCEQISMMHTLSNKDHLKYMIESKLNE